MKLRVLVFFLSLGISGAAAQPTPKAKQPSRKAKRIAKKSKKRLTKRPARSDKAGRESLRKVVRTKAYERTPKRAETTLLYSTNGRALLEAVKASGKGIVLGSIGKPGQEFQLFLNKKGQLTYGMSPGEYGRFTANVALRHSVHFASVHTMLKAAVAKMQSGTLKYVELIKED